MANRFSQGPREMMRFQPRSMEELSIAPAYRQQRHDSNIQTMAEAQSALASVPVREEDQEFKNELLDNYKERFDSLSRGQVDRNTDDITKLIVEARKNPFWGIATELKAKKDRAVQRKEQLAASGQPAYDLGNASGSPIFDRESGKFKTNLDYNVTGFEKTYDPYQQEFMQDIKASDLGSNIQKIIGGSGDTDVPFLEYIQRTGIDPNRINQLKPQIIQAYMNSSKGQKQAQLIALQNDIDPNSQQAQQMASNVISQEIGSKLDNLVHTKSNRRLMNNPNFISDMDRAILAAKKSKNPYENITPIPMGHKVKELPSENRILDGSNPFLPDIMEELENTSPELSEYAREKMSKDLENPITSKVISDLPFIGKDNYISMNTAKEYLEQELGIENNINESNSVDWYTPGFSSMPENVNRDVRYRTTQLLEEQGYPAEDIDFHLNEIEKNRKKAHELIKWNKANEGKEKRMDDVIRNSNTEIIVDQALEPTKQSVSNRFNRIFQNSFDGIMSFASVEQGANFKKKYENNKEEIDIDNIVSIAPTMKGDLKIQYRYEEGKAPEEVRLSFNNPEYRNIYNNFIKALEAEEDITPEFANTLIYENSLRTSVKAQNNSAIGSLISPESNFALEDVKVKKSRDGYRLTFIDLEGNNINPTYDEVAQALETDNIPLYMDGYLIDITTKILEQIERDPRISNNEDNRKLLLNSYIESMKGNKRQYSFRDLSSIKQAFSVIRGN